MKRTTFKILFYIQKTRIAKDGQAPILLRVTVNGGRAVISVNLKVNPKNWNAVAGQSIANSRMDIELNARLETIRFRLMQVYRDMEFNNEAITAQNVINKYLGKDDKPAIMLLDVFREHNDRCHKLAGNGMSPATVVRYETSYKHTANFIKLAYSKDDIPIADVDHKFITDYEFYLRTERKCNHNSATKYLKNFKKIIRIALAHDYITKDPFANIRFKLDEVERDFLEDHEIKAIMEKEITVKRLAQVRDVFVFAIFTGLAFSDLKGLRAEHLVRDNNGDLWIRKARQKTKNMCNIPLLDPAREILEKYKDNSECVTKGVLLPTLCNQKMNVYLKELATICAINKEISTHMARHTMATTVCLSQGVPIETVSQMLGHSNIHTTQIYAKITNEKISRDMAALTDRIGDKYQVETDRPKSDFRNIGKVGKRKQSML